MRQRSHSGAMQLFSYHPDAQSSGHHANRRGQTGVGFRISNGCNPQVLSSANERARAGMPIADVISTRPAHSFVQIPVAAHAIREMDHTNSNVWHEFATENRMHRYRN